jgi:hypothetical protein
MMSFPLSRLFLLTLAVLATLPDLTRERVHAGSAHEEVEGVRAMGVLQGA